jgi:hypothetical protein
LAMTRATNTTPRPLAGRAAVTRERVGSAAAATAAACLRHRAVRPRASSADRHRPEILNTRFP